MNHKKSSLYKNVITESKSFQLYAHHSATGLADLLAQVYVRSINLSPICVYPCKTPHQLNQIYFGSYFQCHLFNLTGMHGNRWRSMNTMAIHKHAYICCSESAVHFPSHTQPWFPNMACNKGSKTIRLSWWFRLDIDNLNQWPQLHYCSDSPCMSQTTNE